MLSVLQFSLVQSLSYLQLCDPMNCSTPGLPVHHQLPEFTQTQRPLSRWCHPAISSSVVLFSSCPQSLLASESFPVSQLFAWGGQSIGVSALASFPPKKSQGWSPSFIESYRYLPLFLCTTHCSRYCRVHNNYVHSVQLEAIYFHKIYYKKNHTIIDMQMKY